MPIRMDVLDDIERRGSEVREREIAKFKADGARGKSCQQNCQASKATAALQASHGVPTAPLPREKPIPARANNVAVPQAPAKASDSQIQQGTINHQNYGPAEQADHITEILDVQNMLLSLTKDFANRFCAPESIPEYVTWIFSLAGDQREMKINEIRFEYQKSHGDRLKEELAKAIGRVMNRSQQSSPVEQELQNKPLTREDLARAGVIS